MHAKDLQLLLSFIESTKYLMENKMLKVTIMPFSQSFC